MFRIIAAVRDALIVLAFVACPPAVLLAIAGSPLPDPLPSAAAVRAWVDDPLQPHFVAATGSTLGWLLWAAYTAAIVAYLTARLRATRPRWRRSYAWLPSPLQGLAATLVGAAAVTSAAVPPATAATAVPATDGHSGPDRAVRSADNAASAASADTTISGRRDGAGTADERPSRSATDTGAAYRVRRGDTLSSIAENHLGDADRWPEIFTLNRGTRFAVGGALTDPDLIYPRWVLKLPTYSPAPPPAHRPETPGPDAERPGHQPDPGPDNATAPTGAAPAAPASGAATRTPSAAAPTVDPSHDRTGAPAPAASAPNARTTATTSPTTALPEPAEEDPSWIEVAGGVMGAGLAAGLVYAAGMVWRRRRHRYRPSPITSPTPDDRDLATPLATLTRLRHGVRRCAPELLDATARPEPTVREYLSAPVKPEPPRTGPSGAELAGLGTLPVTGGVGLDGPGARGAARAALVAALTSGSPDDPHAQGHVVVPATTLAGLLGASAMDLQPTPRLTIMATLPDALATVEQEIIRRSRILADHDAADVHRLREHATFAEPLPQLLLIADAPSDSWHNRLATAAQLGTAVDIGTVLIGTCPNATTVTVDDDGRTRAGDGQRLAVLDAAATTNLLVLLAEAHGDTTTPPPAESSATQPHHTDTSPTRAPSSGTATTAPVPDFPTSTGALSGRVPARVLGRPALLDTDGTPVRGLRAKSLELFVYLVVHRDGATLTSIMEALWPDVTVSRATERLSTCVANLRTTIRSLARTGDDRPDRKLEPVINTGGHYHLDPTLLDVDWWTVLDAYTAVATTSDDDTRLAHLRTAITVIHGRSLADDMPYDWIDTDREHARRRLITIYADAASLLADTDPHTSRAYLDTACALDPLSDDLARRAMQAAANVGDADGVRHRFALLRAELDDAGIDIDAATEHLAADLLQDLNERAATN
jgi:DNA-binding SARP family transcriptional activator/LysM repeat protein